LSVTFHSADVEQSKAQLNASSFGGSELRLLDADHGQNAGTFRVYLNPFFLRGLDVDQFRYGLDWTGRNASPAIDACIRIDVEPLVVAVKTADRTGRHAIRESTSRTIVGHDVRHGSSFHRFDVAIQAEFRRLRA
jgi:hypothetical protein